MQLRINNEKKNYFIFALALGGANNSHFFIYIFILQTANYYLLKERSEWASRAGERMKKKHKLTYDLDTFC